MHQKKHLFKTLTKQEETDDLCHENSDLLESQLCTDSEDSDQKDDIKKPLLKMSFEWQQLERSSKLFVIFLFLVF